MLDRAIRLRRPGPYQLQAAIASLSAEDEVDWHEMVALYGRLAELTPSPVVELNRAVAVAEAEGAASGLQLLDGLDADLGEYHLLHSARADFLRRLDRPEEAAASYRRALELAPNETERRYLARRLAELG